MIEEKLYVATIGYSTQIIQTPSKFIDIDWIKQNLFKHPDDTYIEVVRNCFFESKCLIIIDESSRIRDKPKTVCTPRRGTMCGNVMICGEDIDNH
ncbi:MAG: hypothetical protein HC836_40280 [Richelia sp. RM2_1_2]|nr:hypothetical protein [Richelia sp. RM2_1_2]